MRNSILLILPLLLFVGCDEPSPHPTPSPSPTHSVSPSPSPTPSPSPSIPQPDYSVIERDRFGLNTIWMFGALNNTPSSTRVEITEALKRLSQPIVRFPGGTIANSYHFSKPGYDGTQPGATQNYIIPFTEIVSPSSSPGLVKISYVLNVSDHFNHISYKGSDEELITENLQAISYLLDHHLSIPIIEIGNELSLTPQLFWRIGDAPLKPIETVEENNIILTEIKSTYQNDVNYLNTHFKEGIDRYASLVKIYQQRVNALMKSRGQPLPAYGVPIHTIRPNNMYYGDTRHFLRYWNTRIRDLTGVHALIPHTYLKFEYGNSSAGITELRGLMKEYVSFFPRRRFWFTEFNANPYIGTISEDDTQEQIDTLNQMIQIFRENNGDYYFLHQLFIDSSGYPLIYKKVSTTSKPVNGTVDSNGKIIPDPKFGKNIFYSPMYCWAAWIRGASTTEYSQLKAEFGCK